MTETAPQIVVPVAATPDRVWQALRDPDLVRRWHGWEDDGLADEVNTIYATGVVEEDPQRRTLVVEGGDRFDVEATDGGALVRVSRAPLGSDPDWDDYYDDITEGWTTFLRQLRFGLEQHDLAERRTLHFDGALPDPEETLLAALGLEAAGGVTIGDRYRATVAPGDDLDGILFDRTENQHLFTVDAWGPGLLAVAAQPRNPDRPDGGVLAILTLYGVDDATFAEIEHRWTDWWESVRETPDDE